MHINKGNLFKTLGGRIVTAEKETVPGSGYWLCNDRRIHFATTLRELNAVEQKLYATSQRVGYITDHIENTDDHVSRAK